MREDQRFEIERAFDLLPHVVGASWATIWFRLNREKPTREEFREKTIEYFNLLNPLFESYENNDDFQDIIKYIKHRQQEEIKRISNGENKEIEKRYNRFIEYQ